MTEGNSVMSSRCELCDYQLGILCPCNYIRTGSQVYNATRYNILKLSCESSLTEYQRDPLRWTQVPPANMGFKILFKVEDTQKEMLFLEQNCLVQSMEYFINLNKFLVKSNKYLKSIKM